MSWRGQIAAIAALAYSFGFALGGAYMLGVRASACQVGILGGAR